ncbi:MAG: hypothetical protein ACRCWS_02925 [Propionibacteriaceae bacterium]
MSSAADGVTAPDMPQHVGLLRRSGIFAVVVIATGILGGVLWYFIAQRPSWVIQSDGSALISERSLAQYFSTDLWFVITGAVAGLGLGAVAFRWFRTLGGWVTIIAGAGAATAAFAALGVGWILSPGPLAPRLANALPGDHVAIDFSLRSPSALLVWPFTAMIPILLLASFLPDPEDPARHQLSLVAQAVTDDELAVPTSPTSPAAMPLD